MRVKRVLVAAIVVGFSLAATSALASDANGNHDTYIWVVGATTPSVTAMAPDGSTITMAGSGTLTAGPGNAATGGGTYSLSSGGRRDWSATGVPGFVRSGPRTAIPGAFGGEAKLNVTLDNGASGVLTITCLQGSPPAGKGEGITLTLGNGGQFTKQVEESGNTVFITT